MQDTDIDGDGDRPALDEDSDGDNLCDGLATAAGCVAAGLIPFIGEDVADFGVQGADETNPMNNDSDNDAVGDESEVYWYETFDCDTRTVSHAHLGLPCAPLRVRQLRHPAGRLRPRRPAAGTAMMTASAMRVDFDSDGDGMLDGFIDTNGDGSGSSAKVKMRTGTACILGDANRNRTLDAAEDGKWKETDPLNNTGDTDGDGLSDADEVLIHKTNPFDSDTDGDGLNDYFEVITMVCLDPLKQRYGRDGLKRWPGVQHA